MTIPHAKFFLGKYFHLTFLYNIDVPDCMRVLSGGRQAPSLTYLGQNRGPRSFQMYSTGQWLMLQRKLCTFFFSLRPILVTDLSLFVVCRYSFTGHNNKRKDISSHWDKENHYIHPCFLLQLNPHCNQYIFTKIPPETGAYFYSFF